jgi:hypothetical protein
MEINAMDIICLQWWNCVNDMIQAFFKIYDYILTY